MGTEGSRAHAPWMFPSRTGHLKWPIFPCIRCKNQNGSCDGNTIKEAGTALATKKGQAKPSLPRYPYEPAALARTSPARKTRRHRSPCASPITRSHQSVSCLHPGRGVGFDGIDADL